MFKYASMAGAVSVSALLVSSAASAGFYSIGDGVAESSIGVNFASGPSQAVYLNTFSLGGGDTAINRVSIAFSIPGQTNLLGQGFTAVLYSDANGGTPWDGTLVWSSSGTITSLATFIDIAVPNVNVAGNFAVGFLFSAPPNASLFPAGFDTTAPVADRSYVGYTTGTINLNNLSGSLPAGQFGTIESFGFGGNWTITANGIPAPGALALLGVAGLVGRRRR